MEKTNIDYNFWHKEAYQTDLENSLKCNKILHSLVCESLGFTRESRKKKLLDVACGKGVFLKEVQNRGLALELYGLDVANVAIEVAKNFVPGVQFVVGDAENMPYQDNFFDYVTCLGGLEYYINPQKGADEMYRVLKKRWFSLC